MTKDIKKGMTIKEANLVKLYPILRYLFDPIYVLKLRTIIEIKDAKAEPTIPKEGISK